MPQRFRTASGEPESATREAAPPAPKSDEHTVTLAHEVSRLQSLVGNRVVSALIARAPLQRDAKIKPKEEQKTSKGSGIHMSMDDVGSFELLSFSQGNQGSPGGGSGGGSQDSGKDREGGDRTAPTNLVVSKQTDNLSPKLMQISSKGDVIESAVITMTKDGKPYLTITLKNVYITSFQPSGGGRGDSSSDTMSLSAESIEQTFEKTDD